MTKTKAKSMSSSAVQERRSESSGNELQFVVGPLTYRVIVWRAPLVNREDKDREVAGLASWLEKTIWISSIVPPDGRLSVLLHEIMHCWLFDVPTPHDTEDQCNLFGAAAACAMRQLLAQGGEAALKALKPRR